MLHIKDVENIKNIIPDLRHGELSPKNGTRVVLCTLNVNDVIKCVKASLFNVSKVTKDLCMILGNNCHFLAECIILHVEIGDDIVPIVTIKTFEGPDKYGFLKTHNYTNID